jgi:putative ABC transport system permease protein
VRHRQGEAVLVLRLVLRALRWRAAASITVFIVAVIAVLSATVGPIYLHATNQVVLTDRLRDSPHTERDVLITRDTLAGVTGADWSAPIHSYASEAQDPRWFGPPVYAQRAVMKVVAPLHRLVYDSRLVVIDGQCQHLTFVTGRCASTDKETVVSARAARTAGWRVGDKVTPQAGNLALPIPLTIAGIYQPTDPTGDYWAPWQFFDAAPQLYDGTRARLDSFFVVASVLTSRTTSLEQSIEANVPLLTNRVGLDDRDALRAAVRSVQKRAADAAPRQILGPVTVRTQLIKLVASLNRETSLAATLVTLATAQLALLAICVLYAIVVATAAARGPEVALAKLRGRRPWSILAQGLLEPAILVLTAAVGGAALAWVVVRLVSPRLLAPDAVVAFPRSAVLVAVLATAAALLATIVAARRIVRSPVADLLRRGTDGTVPSTGLAVADAMAVTIAIAGLIELAVGGVLTAGKADPLSVLAPVLLAIAVAIVGLRLLPYAGRAVLGWTQESRHIVVFLAVRQIVRRAAGTRLVLLISIALALATFAVSNWSVARSNREIRALNQAGAARVLTVVANPGVDLRTAVDKADPGGHDAMAAMTVRLGNTPLLALDATRMAGVAAWRPDYSTSSERQVIDWLHPRTAVPVIVKGQELRVEIALTATATRGEPVRGSVTLSDDQHRRSTLDLGTLRPGRAAYRASLSPDCARGCRVTGLQAAPADTPFVQGEIAKVRPQVDVTISSIEVADAATGPWRRVDAGLTEPARWRIEQDSSGVSSSDGSLAVSFLPDVGHNQWPVLVPADVGDHVPAVLASETVDLYPGKAQANASASGLDGNAIVLDGSLHSVTLPQLDRVGAMVDLTMAERAMTDVAIGSARSQVWLSKSAPDGLTRRLEQQGLRIVETDDYRRHLIKLDHTGPAFADSLFVVAAGAATVLAIGATVLGGLVTARRRSYELAALEAVGVSPRSLRRATAAEQGLLLAVGLVLGVLAGIGGAVLALPSTPFFVETDVGPPVEYGLPRTTLAVLVAAIVVILAITCLAMARLIEGQATASRLREAQQ